MRRMGLSCQRELYVCIVNNLGISDCVTSYDLKKLDEMFAYYGSKGCDVKKLGDYIDGENTI